MKKLDPKVVDEALRIYATDGPTAAANMTGISKGAVCKYAKARGVETNVVYLHENATKASVARRARTMAEWREDMTERLQEISTLAAEVELDLLTKTNTLDKATQCRVKSINDLMLLSGEATTRVGLNSDVAAHATAVATLRDELAMRRAQ